MTCLKSLVIKDFILIEKLELDFDQGFVAITGETGAGKSILLDAILFSFGHNIAGEPIKFGAESCLVAAYFSPSEDIIKYLKEFDIQASVDEDIIIKRVQQKSGKKKLSINDQPVSVKTINGLFELCLEVNGQHNHTNLLNPAKHLDILDEFGKSQQLRDELSKIYNDWQKVEKDIVEITNKKESIAQEIDYLSHNIDELIKANIEDGEEEKLSDLKHKLQNKDKEIKLIETILSEIDNSEFGSVIARMQKSISKASANMDQISSLLEDAYDKIEHARSDLEQILSEFDYDEYRLEDIDDRLYKIRDLARKHGCHPSELPKFLQKYEADLASLQAKILNIDLLSAQAAKLKEEYFAKAKILSQKRQASSLSLAAKVQEELAFLEMKKASFKIEVLPEHEISAKGTDKVRFIASTNPGNPELPIDKIASGGELSRFMLALRVALFDIASIKHPIIFDEIDVGISGLVANSIGERLKKLGEYNQIIVITHQPQVAGKATEHILVKKVQHDSRTEVSCSVLDQQSKLKELARMISGRNITDASILAASELIE